MKKEPTIEARLGPDGRCTCGHVPTPREGELGYGVDDKGNTYCYQCVDVRDREQMEAEGRFSLSVVGDMLCNGTGGLRFPIVRRSYGAHRRAGRRTDLWFVGPCRMEWQGTAYGDGPAKCHRLTGIRQLMEQLSPQGVAINLRRGEYRVSIKHDSETASTFTDPVAAFNRGLELADIVKERKSAQPIRLA